MMNPFDKKYVMKKTIEGMRSAIDFSVKKTMMRNDEFRSDDEKYKELLETLSALGAMHKMLDEFEKSNPEIFE
jgi:hypothetical protein